MIAGSTHFSVPVEATAFLGAVAAFVVLLLVFFLYLNKKWCFYGIGGFPCCDEPIRKARSAHSRNKELGHSYYGCEEAAPEYSSSDSDEDVFRRLRRSTSVQALPSRQPLGPSDAQPPRRPPRQDAVDQPDLGGGGRALFGRQGKGTIPLSSPAATGDKGSGADLISLAEKGRVGGGGVSSGGGSSSCSTTSGDEEAAGRRPCTDSQQPINPQGRGNGHRNQTGRKNGSEGASEGQRALRHRDPRSSRKGPSPPVHDIVISSESHRDQDCIVVVPQEQHLLEAYPNSDGQETDAARRGTVEDCALQTTTSSSTSPSPSDDRNADIKQQIQEGAEIRSAKEGPSSPTPLVSKCGHLEVAFAYDAPLRKMSVHVLQARGIPARDRGGATHTQVRLLLLPSKKQKHKTKIRQGDNPQYMESFLLHRVNPEDVNSMGVRFRVYGCERMRRERLIGEYMVGFAAINLELETTLWLPLEPRASLARQSSASDLLSLARSDSTGSTHSMQHGGVPELLLGLAYNGTTGRLSAEIVKGSHFRDMALTRAPDTHVRLCLVSSSGQELAHSKTSVRRSQPNPLFKEVFMFQVALFQLPDVTLMVSVFNKRSMKRKEMVGWFSLGLNSSGEEELVHWNDMRDARGEQICRWHVLLES